MRRLLNLLVLISTTLITAAVTAAPTTAATAAADTKLSIHAVEWGVAKFHRYDNKQHPYSADNVWINFIMPDATPRSPALIKNADGSYSILFKTLAELTDTMEDLVKSTGGTVVSFDINAHGLPGRMWFPRTKTDLNGLECADWRRSAYGEDRVAYAQYYTAVSKSDLLMVRQMAEDTSINISCTVGARSIIDYFSHRPNLAKSISKDANFSFLSCVVGLGSIGKNFTGAIAAGLLPVDGQGLVQASLPFGLGDWSIQEGMGFWDYQNDEQLEHDGEIYPVKREDALIQQVGTIRIARNTSRGVSLTEAVGEKRLIFGRLPQYAVEQPIVRTLPYLYTTPPLAPLPKGTRIRVPGTNGYVVVR